jgi:DNA-binding IclR family transcriptional regulator
MHNTNDNKNKFKYPIHSVEHAFSLLEILLDNGLELGITELCRKTSLPKGTIHRLLGTLKNIGYIEQNPQNRKYHLTLKMLKLGTSMADNIGLSQVIPYMKKLSQKFNESISLAILDRDEIVHLYSLSSDNTLKLDLKIGSNQPAYCTALGRVLIAYLPEEEIDNYFKRIKLKSYTSHTITNKDKLKRELKLVKQKGYSFVSEEYMRGVSCLAVPLKDNQGKVGASVSFSIPTARFDKNKLSLIIDSLISTAGEITISGFF